MQVDDTCTNTVERVARARAEQYLLAKAEHAGKRRASSIGNTFFQPRNEKPEVGEDNGSEVTVRLPRKTGKFIIMFEGQTVCSAVTVQLSDR